MSIIEHSKLLFEQISDFTAFLQSVDSCGRQLQKGNSKSEYDVILLRCRQNNVSYMQFAQYAMARCPQWQTEDPNSLVIDIENDFSSYLVEKDNRRHHRR